VRHSAASKDMRTEDEDAMGLQTATKLPVKTQQTGRILRAVMEYRVCELAIAL
jgi:hypothetical protein